MHTYYNIPYYSNTDVFSIGTPLIQTYKFLERETTMFHGGRNWL